MSFGRPQPRLGTPRDVEAAVRSLVIACGSLSDPGATGRTASARCAELTRELSEWAKRTPAGKLYGDTTASSRVKGALEALPGNSDDWLARARAVDGEALKEPLLAESVEAFLAACDDLLRNELLMRGNGGSVTPYGAPLGANAPSARRAPTFGASRTVGSLADAEHAVRSLRFELEGLQSAAREKSASGAALDGAAAARRVAFAAQRCELLCAALRAWARALRVPGELDGGRRVRAAICDALDALPSAKAGWLSLGRGNAPSTHTGAGIQEGAAGVADATLPAEAGAHGAGKESAGSDGTSAATPARALSAIAALERALLPVRYSRESGRCLGPPPLPPSSAAAGAHGDGDGGGNSSDTVPGRDGALSTSGQREAATFGRSALVRNVAEARLALASVCSALRLLCEPAATGGSGGTGEGNVGDNGAARARRARSAAADAARCTDALQLWAKSVRIAGPLDGGADAAAALRGALDALPAGEASWLRLAGDGGRHSGSDRGRGGGVEAAREALRAARAALLPIEFGRSGTGPAASPGPAAYPHPTIVGWADENTRLVELHGARALWLPSKGARPSAREAARAAQAVAQAEAWGRKRRPQSAEPRSAQWVSTGRERARATPGGRAGAGAAIGSRLQRSTLAGAQSAGLDAALAPFVAQHAGGAHRGATTGGASTPFQQDYRRTLFELALAFRVAARDSAASQPAAPIADRAIAPQTAGSDGPAAAHSGSSVAAVFKSSAPFKSGATVFASKDELTRALLAQDADTRQLARASERATGGLSEMGRRPARSEPPVSRAQMAGAGPGLGGGGEDTRARGGRRLPSPSSRRAARSGAPRGRPIEGLVSAGSAAQDPIIALALRAVAALDGHGAEVVTWDALATAAASVCEAATAE